MNTPRSGLQTSRIGRRAFLAGGIGALSAAALAACSPSSPSASNSAGASSEPSRSGVVNLTFWAWSNLQNRVDRFNETHKGKIHVDLTTIPAGTSGGYAKMFSALKAGNAPDIATIEFFEIPTFLVNSGVQEISRYAKPYEKLFSDWTWQQGSYNGGQYSMPVSSSPMGVFYRHDLFDQWGVEVPATWDDFAAAADTVRSQGSYICSFPPGTPIWFIGLCWQKGTPWFDTDGEAWVVNIDNDASRDVASYWQDLVSKKLVATETGGTPGYWRDLQTGHLATHISGSFDQSQLRTNVPDGAGKWKVADVPQWQSGGTFAAASEAGSAACVLAGSKYPREAVEFLASMGTDPAGIDLAVDSVGGWPSIADLSKVDVIEKSTPAMAQFYSGQNIFDTVFKKADAGTEKSWRWAPQIQSTLNSLTDGFTAAINGNGTFSDALAKAQKDTVSALKDLGLKVKSGS